ncbi:MAG TPA: hypothetical protein VGK73_23780 [Polyangiaceae bacterium]
MLGSWAIYEFIASVSEAVTVERSLSAALRLAALLVAAGIVCGRAAAGDWVDAGSAVRDFVDAAWPVPMVAAGFGSVERLLAPPASAAERHASSPALSGVVPGMLVVGSAW